MYTVRMTPTNEEYGHIKKWLDENMSMTSCTLDVIAIDPNKYVPVVDYCFWEESDALLFIMRWK